MNWTIDREKMTVNFSLAGDLVSTTARDLLAEITALLEKPEAAAFGWTTFQLDLASAKMIDSVGLNLIALLLKRVQKRGARLRILYASRNVHRTFLFTRLDKHVELVKV
ncbi:MAG TPA: STAS domain-containing protein [Verrucomicrobiae bacterium]|jgi:anti-anti-sigma factor|nr:STAS domain-containing protein [Verrucomicrobiae bacterium]